CRRVSAAPRPKEAARTCPPSRSGAAACADKSPHRQSALAAPRPPTRAASTPTPRVGRRTRCARAPGPARERPPAWRSPPRPPAQLSLQTPKGEGVGGETEVRLRLPAAGWVPEEIAKRFRRMRPLRVLRIGQARQVQEHEAELERVPTAVLRDIERLERVRAP